MLVAREVLVVRGGVLGARDASGSMDAFGAGEVLGDGEVLIPFQRNEMYLYTHLCACVLTVTFNCHGTVEQLHFTRTRLFIGKCVLSLKQNHLRVDIAECRILTIKTFVCNFTYIQCYGQATIAHTHVCVPEQSFYLLSFQCAN